MNGTHGRYSGRPLPPYTYVSGRTPHPIHDPAGHLFHQPPSRPPRIDPARWPESADYLYGVDLFNAGYYWEAHEVWEGLWHAENRTGPVANFLKGLIKLAAAGVKRYEGRTAGIHRHAARAEELFRSLEESEWTRGGTFLGLSRDDLLTLSHDLQSLPPQPAPEQILLPGLIGTLTLSLPAFDVR